MSIFTKLSLLACSGVLVFALSACPPSQEEPAGDVEEVEAPAGTEEVVEEEVDVVEEAPADDSGDAADDSGDGSDDAAE